MENTYIFLIWNKALWCKDKIINDLKKDFEIIYENTIIWDKEYFKSNLESLYGRKLGPVREKIVPCGIGPFYLVVIKDHYPKFEERQLYDGRGIVNSLVYDKKMKYRKWTAGSHRIHCSDDLSETNHDIAVLFGNDFKTFLKIHNPINLNTKGIVGFNSIDDLLNCLKLFGNNITIYKNNIIYIFAKCRFDIVKFLHCRKLDENLYEMTINSTNYNLYIYGELDADLPESFFYKYDNKLLSSLIDYSSSFNVFLKTRTNVDKKIQMIFQDYNLTIPLYSKNTERISKNVSKLKMLKNELKLLFARIKFKL